MVVIVSGKDEYRAREKIKELIVPFKNQVSSINPSFEEVLSFFKQGSIFSEKKAMVVFDLSFKEEPEIKGDDLLVVRDSEGKLKWKKATVYDFPSFTGTGLKKWVAEEFSRLGAIASDSVISKLIERAGNDSWALTNEIKKLSSYSQGRKLEIKDVELLVQPLISSNIFLAIDAIANQNRKQAFTLFKKELEAGSSPLYVLSMIVYQLRNLLTIKDLSERHLPLSGIHPFVARKSLSQSASFSLDQLKRIYQKAFQVDLEIKKGRLSAEAGLELLIAEICTLPRIS